MSKEVSIALDGRLSIEPMVCLGLENLNSRGKCNAEGAAFSCNPKCFIRQELLEFMQLWDPENV